MKKVYMYAYCALPIPCCILTYIACRLHLPFCIFRITNSTYVYDPFTWKGVTSYVGITVYMYIYFP